MSKERILGMYELHDGDFALLRVVDRILATLMKLSTVSWAQKATIAKMLHVTTRLPRPSGAHDLSVGFTGPRVRYGDAEIYFHLTVALEGETAAVTYGGHYYHPLSGGDSFTVFRWTADPESSADLADFRPSLEIVLQLVDPMFVLNGMHENLDAYELDLVDDENSMLGDAESPEDLEDTLVFAGAADEDDEVADDAEEEDEDHAETEDQADKDKHLVVSPITPEDAALLSRIGAKLYTKSAGGAYGVEVCDGCGVELASGGLFVDGSAGSAGWGNYCSACALLYGAEIGWGKGQLYAQQPDGTWKGVAGFKR